MLALFVSAWATWTLANVQQLESTLEAAHRGQEKGQRELLASRMEQRLLQSEQHLAAARVADLQGQAARLASQVLMAEADLRTRVQDVAAARTELAALRGRSAATDAALSSARLTLARTTLTAFVTTYLSRAKEEISRTEHQLTMLYDPSDPDFRGVELSWNFMAQARGDAGQSPKYCRLSERFALVGMDGADELDMRRLPIMQALCVYLRGTGGGVRIDDANRARDSGRDPSSLERWEELGDDGPFLIQFRPGSRVGGTFESDSISSFWYLLDAAGIMSIPGTRQLLLEPQAAGDEIGSILNTELTALQDGWANFAQNLQTERLYNDWASNDQYNGPPPLPRLERVSIANLREGRGMTTRGFQRSLLCAAAWYTQGRQLIEEFARRSYCAVY